MLRLTYEVKGLFAEWLGAHHPQRAQHMMSLVRKMRRGKDYDLRYGVRKTGEGPYASVVAQRFDIACKRLGLNQGRYRPINATAFRIPPATGD